MTSNNYIKLKYLIYLAIFGFGLQITSTAVMNNTSSIFKCLGASDKNIGVLWLIAPLAGLIIQPLSGQISDLSTTKYGKRTPYILVSAAIAVGALVMAAFSHALWLSVITLLLLDCGINGSTESLRALIGDIVPANQRTKAYSLQAIFSGIGAIIASLMPTWLIYFNIFSNNKLNVIPLNLKITLILSGLILAFCIKIFVKQIKEKSFLQTEETLEKVIGIGIFIAIFKNLFLNFIRMPQAIKKFSLIQVFTWSGMFCIWLYFGLALSQQVLHLPIDADIANNLKNREIFENGIAKMGVCFGIYQAFSVIYVLILPKILKFFSPRIVHASSLIIGAISILLLFFVENLDTVYFLMIGFGICWGSIVTLPYVIVTAEIPNNKMGTYLGIFNITITIPQIVCGLFIGYINEYLFMRHAIFTVALGGLLLLCAGIKLLHQDGYKLITIFREWLIKILEPTTLIK